MIETGFTWAVADGGYQFESFVADQSQQKELFLVESPGSIQNHDYQPLLEATGLFREFADIEPTEESVVGFANRYGLLGVGEPYATEDDPDYFQHSGEVFQSWTFAASELAQAIRVWDLLLAKNTKALGELFAWEHADTGNIAVRYRTPSQGRCGPRSYDHRRGKQISNMAHSSTDVEWFKRVSKGDMLATANRYLKLAISAWFKGAVNVGIGDASNITSIDKRFSPQHLLGAIWLQFQDAVEKNKNHRRCKSCKRWFEITPTVARTNRLFCSNACRTKAYRTRQADAVRLANEGKTLDEIVDELGFDKKSVKNWIESRRE